MRRTLLICLLAGLAVPAATAAPSTDGTFALRNGTAEPPTPVVALELTGAIVAQVDRGRLSITTLDGADPVVGGDVVMTRDTDGDGTVNVYAGTNLKLRALDGHYRVRIWGSGVDVNAVGQGKVKLAGEAGDGSWYSVDGSDRTPLPLLPKLTSIGS